MKGRLNQPSRFKFSSCTIIIVAALIFWFSFLFLYHFRVYESSESYNIADLFTQQDGKLDQIRSYFGSELTKEPEVEVESKEVLPIKSQEEKKLLDIFSKNNNIEEIKSSSSKDFFPLNYLKKNSEEEARSDFQANARKDNDLIHISFSTDCSFFQDWQSILVFHSAIRVKQQGRVTRIASGCSTEQQKELITTYEKLFPQEFDIKFFVHFTPDFKYDAKSGKSYDFYNKPYGVYHWLRFAYPPIIDDEIIVLIDPDMIILRPFTIEINEFNRQNVYKKDTKVNLYMDNNNKDYSPYLFKTNSNLRRDSTNVRTDSFGVPYRYQRGIPVSQVYGLGAPWTDINSKNFNKDLICGNNSPCTLSSEGFGEKFFSVGPPYILEKRDFLQLCKKWTELVPKVYEGYPYLLAEMYAYSMAAAHEELFHVSVVNFMVSDIDSNSEGWNTIDNMEDESCSTDGPNEIFFKDIDLPNVLHYCQFYRIGDLGFHKRRLSKTFLNCEYPMFLEIDPRVSLLNYKNREGEKVSLSRRQSRRQTFMLCIIHRALNDMLTYYKEKMCSPDTINYSKTVNLVESEYLH